MVVASVLNYDSANLVVVCSSLQQAINSHSSWGLGRVGGRVALVGLREVSHVVHLFAADVLRNRVIGVAEQILWARACFHHALPSIR